MLYMKAREDVLTTIIEYISPDFEEDDTVTDVVLYGEWCGQGIQKGVAVSELPKMFVIFGIKLVTKDDDENRWLVLSDYSDIHFPEHRIFNIHHFAQNKMIAITEEVERECPVGKAFGVSGIGEGVVWKCINGSFGSSSWFKIKGEMHSVTKVKTLAPIDVEAVENMRAFVESVVTEARLEQGLDNLIREQLKPFEMKSLGDFIRWVYNDVVKEEADTIVANQIDTKKLGSAVANAARPWYIERFNRSV